MIFLKVVSALGTGDADKIFELSTVSEFYEYYSIEALRESIEEMLNNIVSGYQSSVPNLENMSCEEIFKICDRFRNDKNMVDQVPDLYRYTLCKFHLDILEGRIDSVRNFLGLVKQNCPYILQARSSHLHPHSNSLLQTALLSKDEAMIYEVFRENSHDFLFRNVYGRNVLQEAVLLNVDIDIIEAMIDERERVKKTVDRLQESPRKVEYLEMLDINYVDFKGNNLMHLAQIVGRQDLVAIFRKLKVDERKLNEYRAYPSDYLHLLYPETSNYNKTPDHIWGQKCRNGEVEQVSTGMYFKTLGVQYTPHSQINFEAMAKELNMDITMKEKSSVRSSLRCSLISACDKTKELPVYIADVNLKIGKGGFARRDIEEGEFLGEYSGEILDLDLLERRFGGDASKRRYLFDLMNGVVVDGELCGNETRFYNHSSDPGKINVGIMLVQHRGVPRLLMCASRPIKKDEELLYDYSPHYWERIGESPVE